MADLCTERPFTLLYVEDDGLTRDTVCSMLGRRFPKLMIHSAKDGAQGMERFVELKPDLVVTDIKMPVMYGIEMSRRIMALQKTPIIVTSAHSDLESLMDSIEIGISRYVLKPIDKDKLFLAIEDTLAALRLERACKEQQQVIRKLSSAVEQSPSCIVIVDPKGVIEYVNPRFTKLTGYSQQEALGQNLRSFQQSGEDFWRALTANLVWQGELEAVKKSGEPYSESISVSPLFDEQGEVSHFVAVKEDITDKKLMQARLEQLANYDMLTGLYNRRRFIDSLTQSVEIACRNEQSVALLYLDLDGFKQVNDNYGHEAGDLVLKRSASRLLRSVRVSDTVGRVGGDEFTILLGAVDRVSNAGRVAEKIVEALRRPISLPNGAEVRIGASIGIGVFPEDADDVERLLAAADCAMYEVKRTGSGGWQFFSQSLRG